jgi:hypothetical protein
LRHPQSRLWSLGQTGEEEQEKWKRQGQVHQWWGRCQCLVP